MSGVIPLQKGTPLQRKDLLSTLGTTATIQTSTECKQIVSS